MQLAIAAVFKRDNFTGMKNPKMVYQQQRSDKRNKRATLIRATSIVLWSDVG